MNIAYDVEPNAARYSEVAAHKSLMEKAAMNEAAIRKSLCELTEAITALPLPGGKKTASTAGVYESHGRPDRPVDELVDQLRLQIKYLLFDLEATRRENRYLRQLLETRPPRPDRDDKFDNPAQEF